MVKPKNRARVSVRVDDETYARLEALIPVLSTAWRVATVSDVLRALLMAGLKALEAEAARSELRRKVRGVSK